MSDTRRAKLLIERRKTEAETAYENKLERLKKDEDFSEAFSRASFLKFEIAKRKVFRMEGVEELEKEYSEKLAFVENRLKSAGIEKLDSPDYHCKICRDTGFVNGKECVCLEQTRVEINLDDYKFLRNIPDSLKAVNYDFYGDKKSDYLKYAKFINNKFLKGDLNFCTVLGKPGSGKTYLAQVVAKEALLSGKSIKILNSVRLNRELLAYHCAPLESKAAMWDEIAGYDFLLIDDLGVEAVINNVTLQYLYELLAERTELKTLITGNLTLRALEEKYGQRIFSRLSDKTKSAVIMFDGDDYRLNGNQ